MEAKGPNTAVPSFEQYAERTATEEDSYDVEVDEGSDECPTLSKCTSFSDMYVINEAEEKRLKRIAL